MLKRLFIFLLFSTAAAVSAGERGDATILCDGQRVIIRGRSTGMSEMLKKRKELGSRFFYFEEGDERYLVRDAGVVARVAALYDAVHAPKLAEKDLRRRQRQLALEQRRLEKEMDEIERALDDTAADVSALEQRHAALEAEIARLERESERLEEEEERVERQRELAEERLEERLEPLKKALIRRGEAVRLHD